jgi:hypothetical protein
MGEGPSAVSNGSNTYPFRTVMLETTERSSMDRQKLIALFLVLLMIGSPIAYALVF